MLFRSGIEHVEDANNYWEVKPDASFFLRVVALEASVGDATALFQTDVGVGCYGYASGAGYGVMGVAGAGGIGVYGNPVSDATGIKGKSSGSNGVGVWGNTLGGIAVKAEVTLSGTALQISGGIVDGGSQRYTNLADATAATDALNRQTGDLRYGRRWRHWMEAA